jgi:hypothetical protein
LGYFLLIRDRWLKLRAGHGCGRNAPKNKFNICLPVAGPLLSTGLAPLSGDSASAECGMGGIHYLTIPSEAIGPSEIEPPHKRQRTESGIGGLARTNLRFSQQGGP